MDDRSDGAMRDSGRYDLDACGREAFRHFFGQKPRRKVYVADVDTEHPVAHRATHKADAAIIRPQLRAKRVKARAVTPRRLRQKCRRHSPAFSRDWR